MTPAIEVRIEDIGTIAGVSGYKFTPTAAQMEKWYAVPRVGDMLLDLNEVLYNVERVVWYDPHFVRITVRNAR